MCAMPLADVWARAEPLVHDRAFAHARVHRLGHEQGISAINFEFRYPVGRHPLIKLTWLVLGGDPAVRSRRVEQFTAL